MAQSLQWKIRKSCGSTNNKQQERRAAVQSFGEGMDFNDGTRSPPPGGNDGEPQSKRPRLDDRDRSRGTLGL